MRFYRFIAISILAFFLIGFLSDLQGRQLENSKMEVIEGIQIIDQHHILYDDMVYWYD